MDNRVTKAIQFMLSKGCVSSNEFVEFVQSLRDDRHSQLTDERLLEAVSSINSKLRKYNMMIRYTLDDKTHERFYSLISTVDNEITRRASHYTEKEFDYFRLILEELQEEAKPLVEISSLSTHLTPKQQKDLIKEWVKKHWIVIDDNMVRLGPRSRAELDVLMDTRRSESQAQT